MKFKLHKKLFKNIIFQYSVLSFICTAIIAFFIILALLKVSQDQAVKSHSTFYSDFIISIPDNFPEIIPLIKEESQNDHEFEHFLTDLQLYPTLYNATIYSQKGSVIWKYNETKTVRIPDMNEMMNKALLGEFAYHIQKESDYLILHTFYPLVINGENLGVIEITDIDEKNGFSLDDNKRVIILIITIGGMIFYLLLFLLYFNVYKSQDKDFKRLDKSQQLTLYSMSLLAELRDNDTGAHILRTKEYCKILAISLKKIPKYKKYLTDNYIEDLERSAPLHDIGKVGIPDSILLKPGKLTEEEFQIIKKHPKLGADVLSNAAESLDFQSFFEIGIQIALCHHENWDGSGYPEGLDGEKIPLSARIMAIADVYDALRTERTYKKAFSHNESKEIILRDSGIKFDPELVKIFMEVENDFKLISNDPRFRVNI
ncbi:MAG: HD domain-containing protein [Spirochaetaceae bacterium]|jgi:HD-GYP domain-containing protein (c-di-GMP phosphodiesterase class II)|nr:HD domain-containing protein [Spirochaetaceae bacterium]